MLEAVGGDSVVRDFGNVLPLDPSTAKDETTLDPGQH